MKRFAAAAAALGVPVLAASAFAAAAGHRPAPATVHSSALLFGGRVRCSVSIVTPAQVGRPLHVRVRLHNISDQPIDVTQYSNDTWLVVKSADGTRFDTRLAGGFSHGGPRLPPTTIAAGATVSARSSLGFPVRWSGPLRITPGCGGRTPSTVGPTDQEVFASTKLPTLRVRVARSAAPVSRDAAVASVVAASGRLLDNCRPTVPGAAVDGVLYAPKMAAPPMQVRCSVRVTPHRGFDVAQELIVTPGRLKARLRAAYGELTWPRAHPNWGAIAWQFVVTRDRAVPVVASSLYGEKSVKHRQAPEWVWTRSGPSGGIREPCGGDYSISGGLAPDVVWVSACDR
jgi:hypothetical protein